MTYILIMILYSGTSSTVRFPSKESCETALIEKWDQGNMKNIKVLKCIKEVDKNN